MKNLLSAIILATAALMPASYSQITVGTPAFFFGTQGTGEGQFQEPRGIAFASDGTLFVADAANYRVQKFSETGEFRGHWGLQGTVDGYLNAPLDLCIDTNDHVFVLDTFNHRVQKFDTNGGFVLKWGTSGTAVGQFNTPRCIASDRAGNIYVSDSWNNRVQKFTGEGVYIRTIGGYGSSNGKMIAPVGIVVDELGDVYVADQGNYRIQKFSSDGVFITKWGTRGGGPGQFQNSPGADGGPNDMVIDPAGNVVVADGGNNRIQVFTSAGKFIAQFGSVGSGLGQLNLPGRLTFNKDNSRLYVTDIGNVRIQAFDYSVPPPMFLSTTFDGGPIVTWSSVPGGFYQLQAKTTIEDAWSNYGPSVTAAGQTTSLQISMGDIAHRFFRVGRVSSLGAAPGL